MHIHIPTTTGTTDVLVESVTVQSSTASSSLSSIGALRSEAEGNENKTSR